MQTAKVLYMLACCHADPKKRRTKFKDFLPDRRSRLRMTGDEIMGALRKAFEGTKSAPPKGKP